MLGKSFTKAGLSALSGLSEAELEPLVTSLVRKEVLSVQADPRSPERGQYSFLQDLLKRVAYETLAKAERKARHLAAARHLVQAFGAGEQEIVEVVAAHYLDAYRAAPEAEDAPEIKVQAQEMLARAGERAASLAANEEAEHYFERAAELSDEPLAEAALHERAGATAWAAGRAEQARGHFERALGLFEGEGRTHPAARVSARLGEANGGAVSSTRRSSGWRRRSRCSPQTSPTRISRCSRPSSGGCTSSRARSDWRPTGSTPRSRSPSRCGCRKSSRRRSTRRD